MDVHRQRNLGNQCVPSADLVQSDEQHQPAAEDLDRALNDVGIGHAGEPAHHREDRGDAGQHRHGHHHVPAEQVFQHQRPGKKAEGHLRHDADHQHQARKEAAGDRAVTHLQEFGNSEDLVADIVRKQRRRGDAKAHRSGQFDGAGRQSVAIGVAGQSDEVFGPDIGRIERQSDDPPRQIASGQKEVRAILARPHLPRHIPAESNAAEHGKRADGPIQPG